MDPEREDYAEPDLPPHVRGPIERVFRAVGLFLVGVVLLAGWVLAVAFLQMLSDPFSRREPSPLWLVPMFGVPLAIFLRFLYRYQPRVAVAVALLAVWVAGVWTAAVVSSGGFSAHRGSGLWFVPMFGVPLAVAVVRWRMRKSENLPRG
jgi:hypothetical protein